MIGPVFMGFTAAFLAVILFASVSRRTRTRQVDQWADMHAIDRAAAADPAIEQYLATNRALRRLGFVAGVVLPPLVGWVFGFEGANGSIAGLWPWIGYLVGCLWAELTVTRVPGAGRRIASLDVRRVREYLPTGLWWAQVVSPVLVVLSLVAVARMDDPTIRRQPAVGALVAADVIGLLLVIVMWWAQRRIVVRPQPFDRADQRAVDDALRSTTMRMVGATVVIIQVSLIASQVGVLVQYTAPQSGLLMLMPTWIGLIGFGMWLWWVSRGWRPLRSRPSLLEPGGAHA